MEGHSGAVYEGLAHELGLTFIRAKDTDKPAKKVTGIRREYQLNEDGDLTY